MKLQKEGLLIYLRLYDNAGTKHADWVTQIINIPQDLYCLVVNKS